MRLSVQTAIRGVLGLQLMLAVFVLLGQAGPSFVNFDAPKLPSFETPIRPGDQTRRYTRDLPPVPNRPYEMPAGLPSRLSLEPVEGNVDALALIGTISPGDADRIIPELAKATPNFLYLNSPGGSVADALILGRHFREIALNTRISGGDVCLSACPYMFAGGVERLVAPNGTIGVHQHYFGENVFLPAFLAVEDVQRGQAQVMTHLDAMGLDVRLMRHALSTGPNDIYIFVSDELEAYHIVTD